jgi:hypothetical protein
MKPDEIDRLLSAGEAIEPSVGFAEGVMSQINREAETPPGVDLPLKAVVAGLAISALVVIGAFIAALKISALATPQWGGIAGLIECHAREPMCTGAAAVSLALAVIVMLVPPTAYEVVMRARNHAPQLGTEP